MAIIEIKTTEEEQKKVIEAIKLIEGKEAPMSKIAKLSGVSQNRVRYVIVDLLELKKITREPVKAFNVHYVRYKYYVKEVN